MSLYLQDREFSNFIHTNLAIPKIYKTLKWEKINLDKEYANEIDINKGIDYIFKAGNKRITVQERFRESKYSKYNDFTIRYRRDENPFQDRHQSEHYKIEADFFIYGITNCLKINLGSCTDFIKFAVIDLNLVYKKLKNNEILVLDNNENFCKILNKKLICPIKYNLDKSSSFFPVDISLLVKLWGPEIILLQKGFI